MKPFTLLICLFFIHFAYAELTYTPIEGGYEVSGGYNLSGPVVIPDIYNGLPVIKIPLKTTKVNSFTVFKYPNKADPISLCNFPI